MARVNERTSAYLTVTFLNRDGDPDNPSVANYRIDDLESGQQVRGNTAMSPTDGVAEIVLEPSDNALIDQANGREVRIVTVSSTYAGAEELNDEFRYEVVGLGKIPLP